MVLSSLFLTNNDLSRELIYLLHQKKYLLSELERECAETNQHYGGNNYKEFTEMRTLARGIQNFSCTEKRKLIDHYQKEVDGLSTTLAEQRQIHPSQGSFLLSLAYSVFCCGGSNKRGHLFSCRICRAVCNSQCSCECHGYDHKHYRTRRQFKADEKVTESVTETETDATPWSEDDEDRDDGDGEVMGGEPQSLSATVRISQERQTQVVKEDEEDEDDESEDYTEDDEDDDENDEETDSERPD